MKHRDLIKQYKAMSREQLEKELNRLKLEYAKAQTSMGMASVRKKEKKQSSKGSDILRRIRKEQARILTILNERKEVKS